MGLLDIFHRKPQTASIAKDRLQIIVARERGTNQAAAPYLAQLQQELLAVVARYEKLDLDLVSVNVEQCDSGEILELNVVIPENEPPPSQPSGGAKQRGKKKKNKQGRRVQVGKLATT